MSLEDLGLPLPDDLCERMDMNEQANEILNINEIDDLISSLNFEQRRIFDLIDESISNSNATQKLLFVDGPGGSGKTYLLNLIIKRAQLKNKTICVGAYTGIAASLLPLGQTVHSLFGLPLKLTENCASNIGLHTLRAENLRKSTLILIDECSMIPKNALTCINQLLKDVMRNDKLFGGKTLLFTGDFRQIPPVIPNSGKFLFHY